MFITCQECGAQVSIEETNCPQCQYPIGDEYKKNYLKAHFEPIKRITDMSKLKYDIWSSLNSTEVTINNGGKPATITVIKNLRYEQMPTIFSNEDIEDIIWDFFYNWSFKNLCIECKTESEKDAVINAAFCMASLCDEIIIEVQGKSIYFNKAFVPRNQFE